MRTITKKIRIADLPDFDAEKYIKTEEDVDAHLIVIVDD